MSAASSNQHGRQSSGDGGQLGRRPERQQTVHVRGDSNSEMEKLFNVLNQQNREPMQSFKNRKLPPSFFDPNHSRESSQDSTHQPYNPGPMASAGLMPQHERTRSCPAQLPANTLSIPSGGQAAGGAGPNHRTQNSVDLITEQMQQQLQQQQQQQQQAQGTPQWDHRRYFSTPTTQPTSWSSPQTTSPVMQQQAKSLSSGNLVESLSPASSHSPSPAVSQHNIALDLRLPPGWDVAVTADGEVYFINHLNKTTSWYHPSIPKQNQGPGPIKLSQLPPAQQQHILKASQAQQAAAAEQHLLQASQQAQQAAAQQQQQQQSPLQQQLSPNVSVPPRRSPATTMNGAAAPTAANPNDRIFIELQMLQKEKERLKREQEEINRKEQMLQRNYGSPSPSNQMNQSGASALSGIMEETGATSGAVTRPPFQELILKDLMSTAPTMTSSSVVGGIDPFLGSDSHARQNSADSGLGGMGTSYSLPRTPEDFLSNVDEMDSSDGGPSSLLGNKLLKHGLSSDFNMNDMGHGPMDMGGIGEDSNTAMGGDDLVPSLQEDMLSNDLLNDMDIINQAVSPTWL